MDQGVLYSGLELSEISGWTINTREHVTMAHMAQVTDNNGGAKTKRSTLV